MIAVEKLNEELVCWSGLTSARALGQRCYELNYFPWDSNKLPVFLKEYLLYYTKTYLERSIKARYLWKDCPPEYKENYLFLYDLGVAGILTYNYNPTCHWPCVAKASGLNTQFDLLKIQEFYNEVVQLESE